jgi:hypothetical protein
MPKGPANPASPGGRLRVNESKSVTVSAAEVGDDDVQLARLLVRMWSLASGRTVRMDVTPDQLTEDELMLFWADDFSVPGGRHAASVEGLGPPSTLTGQLSA